MAQINIYVTDELRRRMDEVDKDASWSRIASAAFERHLAEVISERRSTDMSDVIARLRASKTESEDSEAGAARKAGRLWAQQKATWAELERIESFEQEPGWGMAIWDHRGFLGSLVQIIRGSDGPYDFDEASQFVEDVGLPEDPSDEALGAFVDGALDVFAQVRESIGE